MRHGTSPTTACRPPSGQGVPTASAVTSAVFASTAITNGTRSCELRPSKLSYQPGGSPNPHKSDSLTTTASTAGRIEGKVHLQPLVIGVPTFGIGRALTAIVGALGTPTLPLPAFTTAA